MFKEGLSRYAAHLNVLSLESRRNYPSSSISYNVVTNILQKEMGFNGLILMLNMKAATSTNGIS
jgi:beta-glucosidase-like glycosyl hydrolase